MRYTNDVGRPLLLLSIQAAYRRFRIAGVSSACGELCSVIDGETYHYLRYRPEDVEFECDDCGTSLPAGLFIHECSCEYTLCTRCLLGQAEQELFDASCSQYLAAHPLKLCRPASSIDVVKVNRGIETTRELVCSEKISLDAKPLKVVKKKKARIIVSKGLRSSLPWADNSSAESSDSS